MQGGAALQIAQIDPSLVRVMQAAIILFALAGLTLARRSQSRMHLGKVDRA
jgi:general nucleoside transport system permease protein